MVVNIRIYITISPKGIVMNPKEEMKYKQSLIHDSTWETISILRYYWPVLGLSICDLCFSVIEWFLKEKIRYSKCFMSSASLNIVSTLAILRVRGEVKKRSQSHFNFIKAYKPYNKYYVSIYIRLLCCFFFMWFAVLLDFCLKQRWPIGLHTILNDVHHFTFRLEVIFFNFFHFLLGIFFIYISNAIRKVPYTVVPPNTYPLLLLGPGVPLGI